eukprot:3989106-Pyramimonas_sp.AAC.1
MRLSWVSLGLPWATGTPVGRRGSFTFHKKEGWRCDSTTKSRAQAAAHGVLSTMASVSSFKPAPIRNKPVLSLLMVP